MKHETYTRSLLKNMEFKPRKNANKAELDSYVQSALDEIAFGIQGSNLTAYNSACAVMAGDDDWQEAGTLQEMQTVVLLADLLKAVLDAKSSLDLHNALEAEEKTKK